MRDVRIASTIAFISGVIGIAFGILSSKFQKRGILALALVILAASLVPFIDTPEPSSPPRSPPFLGFMFLAPLATLYSVFTFRNAPDRRLALGALIGATVIGVLFLLMLGGAAFLIYKTFSYRV